MDAIYSVYCPCTLPTLIEYRHKFQSFFTSFTSSTKQICMCTPHRVTMVPSTDVGHRRVCHTVWPLTFWEWVCWICDDTHHCTVLWRSYMFEKHQRQLLRNSCWFLMTFPILTSLKSLSSFSFQICNAVANELRKLWGHRANVWI